MSEGWLIALTTLITTVITLVIREGVPSFLSMNKDGRKGRQEDHEYVIDQYRKALELKDKLLDQSYNELAVIRDEMSHILIMMNELNEKGEHVNKVDMQKARAQIASITSINSREAPHVRMDNDPSEVSPKVPSGEGI